MAEEQLCCSYDAIIFFHNIFMENAFCLSQALDIPIESDFKPSKGKRYIVFGANERSQELLDVKVRHGCHYLILQGEQLNSKIFNLRAYIDLLETSEVYDFSYLNQLELKRKYNFNITKIFKWYFLAPDGMPSFEERHFDIGFFGSQNKLRDKIKEYIMEMYPHLKLLWIYIGDTDKFTNPKNLTKALANTKYILNIPYYHNALETHRITKALCSGCQVLTNYSDDDYLDREFEEYVHFGSLKKLIDKVATNRLKNKPQYKQYFDNIYNDARDTTTTKGRGEA